VICDSDGGRYNNLCTAICAGASGCTRVCQCTDVINPVTCTAVGGGSVTYANECIAACQGAVDCITPACVAACPDTRDCTGQLTCVDGNVYCNSCVAACRGVACPR
jgi:hypothetical protein